MKITLIAAYAKHNRCIGKDNALLWHLPEDFAFFKAYTWDKPIIMGRKTWQSLPLKPLPGRKNIVISRQKNYVAEGACTVSSLDSALAECAAAAEAVIIGGEQIYRLALPAATDLRLTEVHLQADGDAFFPSLPAEWQEVERQEQLSRNGTAFTLVHYQKANH